MWKNDSKVLIDNPPPPPTHKHTHTPTHTHTLTHTYTHTGLCWQSHSGRQTAWQVGRFLGVGGVPVLNIRGLCSRESLEDTRESVGFLTPLIIQTKCHLLPTCPWARRSSPENTAALPPRRFVPLSSCVFPSFVCVCGWGGGWGEWVYVSQWVMYAPVVKRTVIPCSEIDVCLSVAPFVCMDRAQAQENKSFLKSPLLSFLLFSSPTTNKEETALNIPNSTF